MDIQASIFGTTRLGRTDGQSGGARENSGAAFDGLLRLAAGRTAESSSDAEISETEARAAIDFARRMTETEAEGGAEAVGDGGGQTLPGGDVLKALENLLAAMDIDVTEQVGKVLEEGGIEDAVRKLVAALAEALQAEGDTDGMQTIPAQDADLLANADDETIGAALAALIDIEMAGADRVESLSSRMSSWAEEVSGLGGGLAGLTAMFGREASAIGRSRDSGPQIIVPNQTTAGGDGEGDAEIAASRPGGTARADGEASARDGGTGTDSRGRQFSDALFRLGSETLGDDNEMPTGLRSTFATAGSETTTSLIPTSSAIGQGPAAAGGAAAGLAAEAAAQRPGAGATPVQDQIALHLKKLADNGGDRLRLQLQPTRLGGIDIVMEIGRDGRVQAVVMADKAETLSLLQRDSRALEQALREADLTVDGDSLRFDMADRQERNGEDETGAGSRRSLGDRLWAQGDDNPDPAQVAQPPAISLRAVDITI
ncbi:flagellar hook-length control protein FliK [Fodinicurvata sp. EGI_FJ10296]|uniref:flagellar hook-length control protein FliK n=1 Tax=Fodinicurvata sp. EGI_FJ10296 TaxID=3231908 RepID=UPI00345366A7